MRLGTSIANFNYPGGPSNIGQCVQDIARTAEEAGFYSLWVMDHYFQIEYVGAVTDPMLEGYTTLGFLAGSTRSIRLGTLVTGVIYRNPGILVKTATTLDVLSGGRAYLGIGAAWFEREAKGLGVPFPPLGERLSQLGETLAIAHQMWRAGADQKGEPFHGKHFHLEETLCSPAPLTRPHPPILIGGMGEQKTLRLVAKYADACNLFAFAGSEVLQNKLDVLKRHCDEVGRPYEEIEKTALSRADLSQTKPKEIVAQCKELARLGFQHVIFGVAGNHELEPLKTFGREIVPEVSAF